MAFLGSVILVTLLAACNGGGEEPQSTPIATPDSTPAPPDTTGAPATTPSPAPTPSTPTPAPTSTPPPTGNPFSFEDVQATFEARVMTLTLGAPSAGFSGFTTTVFDARLARGDDSMELSLLIYADREAVKEDWQLTLGESPVPKEGRAVPDHISTWWNENVVVVVRTSVGGIASGALDVFLAIGGTSAFPVSIPPASVEEEGMYVVEVATGKLWRVGDFSRTSWSPDGKSLLRIRCCVGDGGLDVFDAGSGAIARIYEGDVSDAAWSPDGNRLVFSPYGRRPDGLIGSTGLAVINRDGSGLQTLSQHSGGGARSWSPDGRFIAFTDQKFTSSALRIEVDIYLLELSTGEIIKVSKDVGPAYSISLVSLSADSRYLAVAGDYRLSEGGPFRSLVYLYDITTAAITELDESQTRMVTAAWSPDGESLAFVDDTGLYVYDSTTDSQRQLAAGPSAGPILWSPSGSRIVFRFGEPLPSIVYENLSWQVLYVVRADGSEQPRSLPPARSPSWSPYGDKIAYLSEGCITGQWDIYTARNDGSSIKRLTDTPKMAEEGPVWSPTGSAIAFSTFDRLMLIDANSQVMGTLVQSGGPDAPEPAIHLHGSDWRKSPWSPDGRFLVFTAGGGHGICT